jgi:peptide/nickel transport system substrate-binding protein
VAVLTAAVLALAGCGGGSSKSGTSGASNIQAITYAEDAANAPTCIFPMGPLTCYTSANSSSFQSLMFRPLYWLGKDGTATIDDSLSLADPPKWNKSSDALTIHLKNYKWSNGQPVTAQNILFFFNVLKANVRNWEPYSPGSFPDNVTSIKAVDDSTISMKLDKSYNRDWFTYTQLTQIIPWPMAWDITAFPSGVTATSGTLPATPSGSLPSDTPSGAKAVAKFLETQAKDTASYGKSPIWSIVDGPWKIQQLTTTGLAQFNRNADYSGPSNNQAKTFTELPFTSDSSEFNQLLTSQASSSLTSGGNNSISVGRIPPENVATSSRVTSNGYQISQAYNLAFSFMVLNMQNADVGPILKQLYVRQALQSLVDQPDWIKVFYHGVAAETYGPVPLKPAGDYASPIENPYPYSVDKAKSLLEAHGWSVHPGGQTTCTDPGKCGPGISQGEPLRLKLLYVSGNTALNNSMKALASDATKVGIQIDMTSGPFSQVTGQVVPICKPGDASTACAWQMLNWGGWNYEGGYPSGQQLFATGANGNYGGWSNAQTDHLIQNTLTGNATGTAAMDAYQENIAKNLPGMLFLPSPGTVVATAKGLTHYSNNPFSFLSPEMW